MTEGAWHAFREAGKSKVLSNTAVAELERPAVSQSIGTAPPLQGPEPDGEDAPVYATEVDASVDDAEISPDIAPWTPLAPEILHRKLNSSKLRGIGHWSVLAIVPVAAAASLLAVRAGVNPYALCLEWWDVLFGSIFLTACLAFLVLAVWKPAMGRWHPGAPALGVALMVLPLWAGMNAAVGSGCRVERPVMPAANELVPPLPPVIMVSSLVLADVPMPVPRPPELHYKSPLKGVDQAFKKSVQLQPPPPGM
ncbi:hypothetical protein IZ6_13520 [Terrihabitans soli]|uniref:Uncharacterized protein n=1 Tax=Terrihabitans soli TaxID=708113 RepID=A0A6S6QRP0_9HYPH|nr:hypothetical protein [Terrihabitans soli]BCJ90617.1 hypothetical protein IZ6_13520 [Terrihabitans soli]